MRYFLDCEFIEDGETIDLISIGLVAEDGRKFYAINQECDYRQASSWVWKNVLYPMGFDSPLEFIDWSRDETPAEATESAKYLQSKDEIRSDLIEFLGDAPEIWGEWCSYDWVAFCQLFGKMIDLPSGYPMRCRDVAQFCEDTLGLSTENWPESRETDGNHNALLGAETVKARYDWCQEHSQLTRS